MKVFFNLKTAIKRGILEKWCNFRRTKPENNVQKSQFKKDFDIFGLEEKIFENPKIAVFNIGDSEEMRRIFEEMKPRILVVEIYKKKTL